MKYLIGGTIVTSSLPPPFDDSLVVSKGFEVAASWVKSGQRDCQKFKSNGFCPANVTPILVPAWEKLPGPPSPCDDNANASRRAGVGVSAMVCEGKGAWYQVKTQWGF